MLPWLTAVWLAGCADAPPPNVLLLTLDTLRADALGVYGSETGATPNLDQLAGEGVRFDRAYTVTPLTIPAHSSMHTGQYPPRHGVRDNGDFFLGPEAVTLAEQLQGKGYRTMAAVAAEVTSRHWGFLQGFDAYFDELEPNAEERKNRWRVERPGNEVVDDALGWLDTNAHAEGAWMAWIHLFDAHHPYAPPEPFATTFEGRPYAGEVAFVDAQVGRVIRWLKEHGELDNTVVVVVADHGEGLGSHGESMHGVLLYDATTRIPMIVRGPGAKPGLVVSDLPVSLVDLAPTLLDLAGVASSATMDGMSLRAVLEGGTGPADRRVYSESRYAWHHYGWSPLTALVSPEHKLIRSTNSELYARADRGEKRNLVASEPEVYTRLSDALVSLESDLTPAAAASRVELSPEKVAQLEALGYLTGSGGEPTASGVLPDPVTQMPVLKLLEAARQAFRSGDVAEARRATEAALAADPQLHETRLLLISLSMREGKVSEAQALATALTEERPSSQSWGSLGGVQLASARPVEAAAAFREALALDPYVAGHWIGYLQSLAMAGSPEFAAESERAMQHVPDVAEIKGLRGVALAVQGRFAQARPLLEAALAEAPLQPFVHHARALQLQASGDPLAAEEAFEEDIRLFPPALPSRRELVKLYAGQKRYEDQLAQLTVIREFEAPSAETLHSIAQAEFNLGRYPRSAQVVAECRAMDSRYAGCALLEANVLKKLGREAEALEAFARAQALASGG